MNGGFPIPSSFDLYGLDENARNDSEENTRAHSCVEKIVNTLSESIETILNQLRVQVSFKSYPGLQHTASENESGGVAEYMKRHIGIWD